MDAVEEIKNRLAIEDVLGEYVQLKRAGRNLKALSPFTNEKTPSLMISPEKQIWHDFSSGKGGNIFSFVMEMEGVDFKGALELLARKAGVDLSKYSRGQRNNFDNKERLYLALEQATKFYQAQFSRHKMALDYVLKQRGFSKQTALDFRFGYSPNNGSALVEFMVKKGFKELELQQAGLSVKRYQSTSDMFKGRIMIPLADAQGRIIGFTARQLENEPNSPKYINTPSTVLYDKSRHVFGLHFAKEHIRKSGHVVVVEGNMDVVASYQAGVREVVATAGTAITESHLKIISRFTNDIRLAFDQDDAGQRAVERIIPLAGKTEIRLSVIPINGAKDPDELITKNPKLWQSSIENKVYALDWLIKHNEKQVSLDSAEGKRQLSDNILPVVAKLSDSVEQDHYVSLLAKLLGVSAESIRQKMHGLKNSSTRLKSKKTPTETPGTDNTETIKVQDHLLALFLMQPALRYNIKSLKDEMFFSENRRSLFEFINKNPNFKFGAQNASGLSQIDDYVKILNLQYEELYGGLELLELRNEATRLQTRLIGQYVRTSKRYLADLIQQANEKEQESLLKKVKELDQLLSNVKG